MLQSFLQCNSSGMIDCNLRVRKINRTTAALTGNLTFNVDLGRDIETSVDFYHSALGNNQFNKYPMKIGPMSLCDYLEHLWGDYRGYVVGFVPNVPEVGECPLTRRTLLVNDLILDPRIFPPYVPTRTLDDALAGWGQKWSKLWSD
ncbi:hypothetical protein pipiens_009732 [Culex pipiens pipiens]|uniref:Uncharacterized protein n=1 Tax=Culex pipiens pipiens TaxID=38569 RepID=A0ABD1DCU5_CULPP